jgi:hypothetical protein
VFSIPTTPHRVVRAFAEGGFLAIVVTFVVSAAGAGLAAWAPVGGILAHPLELIAGPAGLALGGVHGAASLDRPGIRYKAGSALLGAGFLLALPLPLLRGLTGFEPALPVILVAVGGFGLAFGSAAVVLGVLDGRGAASVRPGTWAAAGGGLGGLALIAPFLLAKTSLAPHLGSVRAPLDMLAASLAILIPFLAIGLALEGRQP